MGLKIFVSSIIRGLERQRKWTREIINNLGFEPLMAEYEEDFLSEGIPIPVLSPQTACLKGVDKSEVVIVLLSNKYGFVQSSGISATHEEVEFAIKKGKILLIFVDTNARDMEDKQRKFLEQLSDWDKGYWIFYVDFQNEEEFKKGVKNLLLWVAQITKAGFKQILSMREAKALFLNQSGRGSSQCSAFLAGEWAVLKVKQALLVPVSARVRTAIIGVAEQTKIYVYELRDNRWVLNQTFSARASKVVDKVLNWSKIREIFPWLPRGILGIVFSDLPFNSGANVEAAFCLSLAAALEHYFKIQGSQIMRLAAAFLGHWYPQMSWAPLVRAHKVSPMGRHLMFFDRRNDGGLDIFSLSTKYSPQIFEANIFQLTPKNFFIEDLNFSLTTTTVWMGKHTQISAAENLSQYQLPLKTIDFKLAGMVIRNMYKKAKLGQYSNVGKLMQIYQLVLAEAGFLEDDYQRLISHINSLKDVLGAKSVCARGRGAILILTRSPLDPSSVLVQELKHLGLTPLTLFNKRPKGTIKASNWEE